MKRFVLSAFLALSTLIGVFSAASVASAETVYVTRERPVVVENSVYERRDRSYARHHRPKVIREVVYKRSRHHHGRHHGNHFRRHHQGYRY